VHRQAQQVRPGNQQQVLHQQWRLALQAHQLQALCLQGWLFERVCFANTNRQRRRQLRRQG
jgi:type III secretory pathway lipoprotein EscJ